MISGREEHEHRQILYQELKEYQWMKCSEYERVGRREKRTMIGFKVPGYSVDALDNISADRYTM